MAAGSTDDNTARPPRHTRPPEPGAARDAGKRQRRARQADDVDEDRSRSVGAGQISLQDLHVEGQPIAVRAAGLKDDDGITDFEPSLLKTDTVAFGGSLAKLSVPVPHSSSRCAVSDMPGRPDRTVSEDDGVLRHSDKRNSRACRLAPRAFKTINDGTTSGFAFACPIVFCSGTCGGVVVAV